MSPTEKKKRVRKSSSKVTKPVCDEEFDGRCTALSSLGTQCKRRAVPGLKVCKHHGGGTSASVRKSRKHKAAADACRLWGINPDTSSINVNEELNKMIRNKLTDITALRIKLGEDPEQYYGLLTDSVEEGAGASGEDFYKEVKRSGVHPLVEELHKAEKELTVMLKLMNEISPNVDAGDVERVRLQTARETARLMKAYPGLGVDEAAAEVTKRV